MSSGLTYFGKRNKNNKEKLSMSEFYEIEPSLENYWRAVILFGRNVASYKFALPNHFMI